MNYIGKFISNFKDFYNEINAATLTGAIDVVVVRQEDGSYLSSPFHVRFGKMGVLRSREKVVDIEINGEPVGIHMKLGESGEAFFVQELDDSEEVNPFLGTSPLPPSLMGPLLPEQMQERLEQVKAEDEEAQLRDSGVDEATSSQLEKSDSTTALTPPARPPARPQDDVAKDVTPRSDIKARRRGDIGIIRIVRKSDPKERRDSETQTDFKEPEVTPKKPESQAKKQENKRNSQTLDTQASKTDGEDTVRTSKSVRRKRKKKCMGKKLRPKSSSSQSSDTSTTSEAADMAGVMGASPAATRNNQDAIFVMDDIDNEKSGPSSSTPNSHLAQSTSMPLLTEAVREDGGEDEWQGMSRSMGPDFHPFSDTDISPPPSASNSRPPTPIKSDTEYEVERQRDVDFTDGSCQTDENKWSWTWGELPTPPPKTPTRAHHQDQSGDATADGEQKAGVKAEDDERSVLGSMFSFMRATKKARHNPESEGIYLDDLNLEELDPEVAALYFPSKFKVPERPGYNSFSSVVGKDDDVESGNGPSLPQSPHSVEGAIGGPKVCSDSDFEDYRHPIFDFKSYSDIAFSLCGRLHEYEGDFPESLFQQSLVTYDDFCENPQILDNPDLVVRFGGKHLTWRAAAPQILSLVLFQRPVPQKLSEDLYKEHVPKKEIRRRTESKGYSWFSWRRTNQDPDMDGKDGDKMAGEATEQSLDKAEASELMNADPNLIEVTEHDTQTTPPGTPKRKGLATRTPGTDSSESEDLEDRKERKLSGDRYKKSLRLTSDQITKLNLREGSNEALFSVTTAYQGTTRCKCHIFLWNYSDKIVVSDIDGTITKSDVLGHLLPILGKDWAQSGVAQLFTKIKNNGYHFLYLSARAIGQARITRDYLRSVKQGDLSLPDGPLLLNPTSLVQAFHREVIEKKPEEFKISCLRDIQALYPSGKNPFYSGYGNKINDVWAYRAVGIPISRIFTINHKGELKHELTQTFQSSYSNLCEFSNHMFPPVAHVETLGEYSSLQYWRPPLPDVTSEIEALLGEERCK